jgi:hypothetical protein
VLREISATPLHGVNLKVFELPIRTSPALL